MVPIFFKISYQISSFSWCHCRILIPKLFGICMQKFGFLLIKFFFRFYSNVWTLYTKCLAAFWTVLLSNLMRKVYSCSWKNQVYHHPVVPLEDRLSLVLDQEWCSCHRCDAGVINLFLVEMLKSLGIKFRQWHQLLLLEILFHIKNLCDESFIVCTWWNACVKCQFCANF